MKFSNAALEDVYHQPESSRDILIYIHPKDFLAVAMSGFCDKKMKNVQDLVQDNIYFNDIPFLNFVHDGEGTARVTGHEGRHRARALLELGINEMPVVLRHRYDENGQAMIWDKMNQKDNQFMDKWPQRLYGERGSSEQTNQNSKNYIVFPIADLRATLDNHIKPGLTMP